MRFSFEAIMSELYVVVMSSQVCAFCMSASWIVTEVIVCVKVLLYLMG